MDKNKIIEGAAKLVAKGAYDKAIKEYQKVLEADPKDVRILQKMGELYQKKNDNSQAAFYFTKVAESYSNDGFFLKAVALYKQVLKLDPSLVDVNLKLAELHQQLQLMSEAMAYYQIVANHYDKAGDTKKSLDTLRKMVDLDPENVASRIKLAELYAREQMNNEAVGEFRRAAEHLKRNNRTDDYVRVAERISTLEPNNLQLARELAEIYLSKSDQKRALAKLQICFKADSRDIETLRLLATAFQGLGQTSKTISVYKELAKVYSEKGRHDESEAIWQKVAQLDPTDAEVVSRRPPAPVAAPSRAAAGVAAPARPPPPAPMAPAAAAAPPAHSPQSQNSGRAAQGENLGKLLTETDVYVKYGLHDKALEHLRKVFSIDPENIDAHEKAYHIYVAAGNQAQSSEQLLNVLRLHTRRGDSDRAQPYLQTMLKQNPGHPEVPAFLSSLRAGSLQYSAEPDSEVGEDAILVDSRDDEIIVADAPEDLLASDDLALNASDGTDDQASPDLVADEAMADQNEYSDGSEYSIDGPPVPDEESVLEPVMTEVADEPLGRNDVQPLELGADEVDAQTGESEIANEFVAEDEPVTQMIPVIENPHSLMTGRQHAFVPPRQAYRDEFESEPDRDSVPIEAVPTVPQPVVFEDEGVSEEAVVAPPDDDPASEECEEATFFVEQGLFEEAREILETVQIAYPGHARAGELMAQIAASEAAGSDSSNGVTHGASDTKDAFDLAAELASELGEMGEMEEQPTSEVSEVPSEDFQYSVEEVFADFKKGLEKVVKPEDVETHYDLGIAYKEMGLIDDAIGEFVVARQGTMGKRKEVDCLSMMAALQMLKGDSSSAIESYTLALASEHAMPEVEKALRYELGGVYEIAGDLGKALNQFLKVQAIDSSYREVDPTISRLSAIASPEEDGAPQGPPLKRPAGSARKVGYL